MGRSDTILLGTEMDGSGLQQSITVAGWRDIREGPLPCVGLVEITHGFVPYTGRFREIEDSSSLTVLPRFRNLDLGSSDEPLMQHPTGSAISQARDIHQPYNIQHHQQRQRRKQQQPQKDSSDDTGDSSDSEERLSSSPTLLDILASVEQRNQRLQNQEVQPLRPFPTRNTDHGFSAYHPRQDGSNGDLLRERLHGIFYRNPAESSPEEQKAVVSTLQSRRSNMALSSPTNNSPPTSPFANIAMNPTNSSSLFTISPQDAAAMVRVLQKDDDSRHCYFINLKLIPLFGDDVLPGSCLRKLPRLVNGIPLGAGFLSHDQLSGIRWRLVEGAQSILTFISCPLLREEAEESKNLLKDRLMKQSQAVFGDMTVKASVVLSRCIEYDDDLILNDIAVNIGEGLHFRD